MATSSRSPAPVLYEKNGPVAVISLNRPQTLNAYDVAMRDALHESLLAVRDDGEVGALILRGNGRAFSSGGDLTEFGSAPSPLAGRAARWARDVWGLLRALPQPTIAAVHGYAVGGGWEMAMLCDLCIASEDTRFALPETGLGLLPGVGGTQTLARRAGLGRGLDWVLTGGALTARRAQRLGLVVRVVPRGRLDREALALARRLAALDGALVTASKRAVWAGIDRPLVDGLGLERRLGMRVPQQERA